MCRKEHIWKWIFFLKECVWKCVAIVCLCLPFFSMYCLVTCARIYLVLIWYNGKVVPWWPVGDRFKSGNNIFAYARVRLRTMALGHQSRLVFFFFVKIIQFYSAKPFSPILSGLTVLSFVIFSICLNFKWISVEIDGWLLSLLSGLLL